MILIGSDWSILWLIDPLVGCRNALEYSRSDELPCLHGVAAKLLAKGKRCCVLCVCSPDLDDVVPLLRFQLESILHKHDLRLMNPDAFSIHECLFTWVAWLMI